MYNIHGKYSDEMKKVKILALISIKGASTKLLPFCNSFSHLNKELTTPASKHFWNKSVGKKSFM